MFLPIGSNVPKMKFPWVTAGWMLLSIISFLGITWPELERPLQETRTFALAYIPAGETGNAFRIFSYQFLHSSFTHLFSNLWYWAIFGWILESILGPIWFLSLSLGAGALSVWPEKFFQLDPSLPIVGCSGSVAFAMGAVLALYPWSRVRFLITIIPLPSMPSTFFIPVRYLTYFWLLLQISGMAANLWIKPEPIAYSTHLAGFGIGVLIGMIFRPMRKHKFQDVELSGKDLEIYHEALADFEGGKLIEAGEKIRELSVRHSERLQVQETLFHLGLEKRDPASADAVWKRLLRLNLILRRYPEILVQAKEFRDAFGEFPAVDLHSKLHLKRKLSAAAPEFGSWLEVRVPNL